MKKLILMVSGKLLPPPENSCPSNYPLLNSPREIPTRNIPIHVFKNFVFSLLSPLSLKDCFVFLSLNIELFVQKWFIV